MVEGSKILMAAKMITCFCEILMVFYFVTAANFNATGEE